MYVYLKGILKSKNQNHVIIENSGIGYELSIGALTYNSLPDHSEEVMLYTYHYIREDKEELYGFIAKTERRLFEMLIGISNIGPGKAINILSQITASNFVQAVRTEDILTISSIKGIGKKTAERLVIDLKDKLIELPITDDTDDTYPLQKQNINDAVSGLMSLGFKENIAREMLMLIKDEIDKNDLTEDIIKKALKKNG